MCTVHHIALTFSLASVITLCQWLNIVNFMVSSGVCS